MKALRRAAASHVAVLLVVLAVGVGIAGGALIGFSAEDQNASSTYAGGWLGPPTALGTPTASGYGASLSWTAATHGLNDQSLYATDQNTTNNCTGVTYSTQVTASLGAAATSTTTSPGASANGHYLCYQIRSVRTGTLWTASANFALVQVGLVGSTMVSNNAGGTAGSIQNGDQIIVSFNQNVTYGGAASVAVCVFATGTLLIGDTGCTAATDTPTIASVAGLTIGGTKTYPTSTVSASGSTLTITLGGGGNGTSGKTTVSGAGTVTWVGGASIVASATGSAPVCTASNCTIAWTSGF